MEMADSESKIKDESSWAISDWHFGWLQDRWGFQPTLDPFVDNINARAPTFYSWSLCPGTAGVDGFTQPWKCQNKPKPCCWVNGPFRMMGKVIAKIQEEQVDCVLITPDWTQPWKALLPSLPITDSVVLPTKDEQGKTALIFRPGSRVPPAKRKIGLTRNPKYRVWAHLVQWPQPPAPSSPAAAQQPGPE